MRKWVFVLLALPLLGCGQKDGTAAASKAADKEIAEARAFIDDIVITFDIANVEGKTDEEIDHEEELIADVDELLERWKFDFDERVVLAQWSGAVSRMLEVEEQNANFQAEFEDDFFSDSMNYGFRTSLMSAFESFLQEHESELHQEIVDLRNSGDDLEAGDHFRQMAQAEIRASEIILNVLETHHADMIGDKEDGLFTTRDLEYLKRHYELIPEIAIKFVFLLDELKNLEKAQKAWK